MEALIVGGGVIGVCSAYYLLREGFSVTIIDQGEIGSGCSYGNAGLIVPSHVVPLARPGVISQGLRWMLDSQSPFYVKPRLDPALVSWLWRFRKASTEAVARRGAAVLGPLAQASAHLTKELITTEALTCDYLERGVMQVFRTAAALDEAVQSEAQFGGSGEVLDGSQVCEIEGALRPDMAGALYHTHDASYDPGAFVDSLAEVCRRQGVKFRQHNRLVDFQSAGGRISRVVTDQGDYSVDQVVLAAGAWTPGLGRMLGLKVPIQPAKGYSLTYQAPSAAPRTPLLLGEDWVAVTPMGGRLRFAGTLELAGLESSLNANRIQAVADAPARYLNLPPALRLIETWSGLRPATPDGLPIIGRPEGVANMVIAAGHAMLGMTLGPATGRLVADLAAERQPLVEPQPFRLERFY